MGTLLLAGRASLFFRVVLASAVFAAAAVVLRGLPRRARAWGQVVASLALIGTLTTAPIAALMAAYAAVLFWLVERAPLGRVRGVVVTLFLALQAIAPIFWLPHLSGYVSRTREFVAFATNLTLLRSWAYAYDRLRRPDPEPPGLCDYALFTFFFPAFVNGPLVSLDEFRRRRLPAYWGDEPMRLRALDWRALLRLATALAAVAPALALAPLLEVGGYEAAARGGVSTAWGHALGIYLLIYFGFTAWTEAAIACARLSGVALPENFDVPHLACGVADFWRRWNITLGHWLRRYVYLPLGGAMPRRRSGARKPEWRNTAAVFGVMAAYHLLGSVKLLGLGFLPAHSYLPWVLWAVMNTVGVLATRGLRHPAGGPPGRALAVVLTLAFSTAGLMTAFLPAPMPLARLGDIYRRMFLLG